MCKRGLSLTLLGLLAIGPTPGLAWNDTGHKTVALIAYRALADKQKTHVVELLKKHPHYEKYLLAGAPDVPGKRNEWIVMQAATWPDWVRPGNPDSEITKTYHVGPRHYINMPFVLPAYLDTFKATTFPPAESDVVKDLKQLLTELRSAGKSPECKAVALCWVLHLVGDIHQPLHCSTFYSAQFPLPFGDEGGNFFIVKHGGNVRLHTYWDDLLGNMVDYKSIDELAVGLARVPEYRRDKLGDSIMVSDVEKWAKESHDLARTEAYLDGKLEGAFSSNKHIADVEAPPLPSTYGAAAPSIAKKRIVLAGYRLADRLSEMLPNDAPH
jgi:hypothetical protein